MSDVGQPERATQNRVIALFRDELGYRYLGDWADRSGNSNIEEHLFSALADQVRIHAGADQRGSLQTPHRSRQPQPRALRQQSGCLQPAALRRTCLDRGGQGDGNRPPHRLAGAEQNDFSVAEEVTLKGNQERRPDIVLYLNGIAVSALVHAIYATFSDLPQTLRPLAP